MAVPCREIVDNAVYISPTFPPRHSPDMGVRKSLLFAVLFMKKEDGATSASPQARCRFVEKMTVNRRR